MADSRLTGVEAETCVCSGQRHPPCSYALENIVALKNDLRNIWSCFCGGWRFQTSIQCTELGLL